MDGSLRVANSVSETWIICFVNQIISLKGGFELPGIIKVLPLEKVLNTNQRHVNLIQKFEAVG